MRITGRTSVAGVIGHPVEHSLSPVIHNTGFASLGLDWVYIALDLAPNRAQEGLEGMRALGIRGLSVTMPESGMSARSVALTVCTQPMPSRYHDAQVRSFGNTRRVPSGMGA